MQHLFYIALQFSVLAPLSLCLYLLEMAGFPFFSLVNGEVISMLFKNFCENLSRLFFSLQGGKIQYLPLFPFGFGMILLIKPPPYRGGATHVVIYYSPPKVLLLLPLLIFTPSSKLFQRLACIFGWQERHGAFFTFALHAPHPLESSHMSSNMGSRHVQNVCAVPFVSPEKLS